MVSKRLRDVASKMSGDKRKKSRANNNFCQHLGMLLYHTNATWVMQVPMRSNTICVHAPSLRRHLGPRVTARDVEDGMRKLYSWRVFLTYSYAADMFVVTLSPPRGMKPDTHDELGRPPVTLPALQELAGRGKRKAQVYEMAVARMAKEAREIMRDE